MPCLFCQSEDIRNSFLPSTVFNAKRFDYKRCQNCNLHFISPLPNEEDLLKMYPPSYQAGVDFTILDNPYKKLIGLRYSYGKQFDLLRKHQIKGKILDFGCGNANFLINCNHHGLNCDGLEFNPLHVKVLKEEIPERSFYTFDEFMVSDIKYDVIRLSNVLEHFTDPKETIKQLKTHLNPGGYFLLEGPIEMNFNFALKTREAYFKLKTLIKGDYAVTHTPTHIIFTNRKNQLQFFEDFGLNTQHFEISEAEWPFPNSISNAKGFVSKINFFIARMSMFISSFNSKWGNTFLYLGQKHK